ncbi:MAG: hypothetical protein QUS09_10460, partial [Methanotrichaceae archaeon]|nr:hypothetical protein [Methanotrichaceae archaeon]
LTPAGVYLEQGVSAITLLSDFLVSVREDVKHAGKIGFEKDINSYCKIKRLPAHKREVLLRILQVVQKWGYLTQGEGTYTYTVSEGAVNLCERTEEDMPIEVLHAFDQLWGPKIGSSGAPPQHLSRRAKDYAEPQQISEENPSTDYIHSSRITELKSLHRTGFDLRKLIRICEEINICMKNECYISSVALQRTLLNHVPPIFGQKSYDAVANNEKFGKSLKENLQRLLLSLKPIADSHLHQHIRSSEDCPNVNQASFSQDMDVLLGEVIRVLREKSSKD